jgi:hypothetical protein
LIRIIKYILDSKWFLEHERKYIETILKSLQKWIIWRNTIKQTKTFLEKNLENNNTGFIISKLKDIIPEEYLNLNENIKTNKASDKIEVILSEYFI